VLLAAACKIVEQAVFVTFSQKKMAGFSKRSVLNLNLMNLLA
jgi:hypothetical protein